MPIQGGQVELHFADELGLKLSNLQIDGDKAFEAAVIEQQINEIFFIVHGKTELAAYKCKQSAQKMGEVSSSKI